MSQQQKHRQPVFCPHLRLQTAVELLFPKNSYPESSSPSPASSVTSKASSSTSLSLSPNETTPRNEMSKDVIGDQDLRGSILINTNHVDEDSSQKNLISQEEYQSSTTYSTGCDNHDQDKIEITAGILTNHNVNENVEEQPTTNSFTLTFGIPRSNENNDLQQVKTVINIKKLSQQLNQSKKNRDKTKVVSKAFRCSHCDLESGFAGCGDTSKKRVNFWKCLEPSCQLILCGAAGENHAQLHYQENLGHMVQENTTSHRAWCNECNHEVFNDFRNRRIAPAIWTCPNLEEIASPKGLYNIGNTCFMNAALQNIVAVAPLNSYLLGDCCALTGKNVASNYRWLLSEFYGESSANKYNKGVMPSRLLHSVRTSHPIFRGFQQHDAQEFLRLFMDTLAEQTLVPHFVLDDSKSTKEVSDNESETESFETCDSGNGSEETDIILKPGEEEHTDSRNDEDLTGRPTKIIMKSIISDIFDGQIESSVQCLSCHQTSRRNEVFQDLSLPIPTKDELATLRDASNYERDENNGELSNGWFGWIWDWMRSFFWGPAPTLEDCFNSFFSSDELKGKNMYSCEKCGKLRNGVKRCSLYKLPEILCVHLKRFRMYEFNGGMGYSGKISQYVQFPSDGLDVRPYMHPDCTDEISNYRLIGVICHIGSVMGGHYTAYIRKGDNLWFLADDSHVGPVSWETVMECEAYVLFYQKWTWEDDENKSDLLNQWGSVDNSLVEEDRFHVISRKWLTKFFWSEEAAPLDNSDVVCPHGYLAPYDNVKFGATWIPQCAWDLIMTRYGGGPELKFSGECSVCSQVWKKHQRTHQKTGAASRTQSFSSESSGSPKSPQHLMSDPQHIHTFYTSKNNSSTNTSSNTQSPKSTSKNESRCNGSPPIKPLKQQTVTERRAARRILSDDQSDCSSKSSFHVLDPY